MTEEILPGLTKTIAKDPSPPDSQTQKAPLPAVPLDATYITTLAWNDLVDRSDSIVKYISGENDDGVISLQSIGGIPDPAAGMVLARNAENDAYEWVSVVSNSGITTLNAQTGPTQTFIGSGNLNIVSADNVHTFSFSLPSNVVTVSGEQTLVDKTLTAPIIADFTSATHDHSNGASGGQIGLNALTASGTKNNTTFLRGDNIWAVPVSGGVAGITSLNGLTGSIQTLLGSGNLNISSAGNAHTFSFTLPSNVVTTLGTETLTNKTLTTPTIGSFTNATHDHSDNAGGGQIGLNALSATGTRNATTFLSGDNTWKVITSGVSGITSLGGLTGAVQTFAGSGGLTISSSGTVHTLTAPSRIHNLGGQTGGTQTLASGTGITVSSNSNIHTFSIESSVVTTTGAQTLSNKVLTTPTVSSFINATHNHSTAATGGLISGVHTGITGLGEQTQSLDMGGNNILDIGTIFFGTASVDVFTTILKDENDDLIFNVAGYQGLRLVESGTEVDVIFGKNTEIALSATSGHIHIPACDGVPTGTPQAYHGKIPMIFDKVNDTLFAYNKSQWNLVGGIFSLGGLTAHHQTFTNGTFIDITSAGSTHTTDLSATGTPSATTYLRGDNTWATITSSGSISAGTGLTLTGNVMSVNKVQTGIRSIEFENVVNTPPTSSMALYQQGSNWIENIRQGEFKQIRFAGAVKYVFSAGSFRLQNNALRFRDELHMVSTSNNVLQIQVKIGDADAVTEYEFSPTALDMKSNNITNVGTISAAATGGLIVRIGADNDFTFTTTALNLGGMALQNAPHDHTNALGGGQLVATTSLTATGTKNNTTYLRGDNTWAAITSGGAISAGTGLTLTGSVMRITAGVQSTITGLGAQTQALDMNDHNLILHTAAGNNTEITSTSLGSSLNLRARGSTGITLTKSTNTGGPEVILGNGTLAAADTRGFVRINSVPGIPTGTPAVSTGTPIIYNSTNNSLHAYSGSSWNTIGGGGTGITSLNGLTGATQTFTDGTFIDITSSGTSHIIDLGATGTPSATKYLRGDNTWSTVPGVTTLNGLAAFVQTFTGVGGIGITSSGANHTFTIGSSIVTLTGTQTLTNKTLTTPTINNFVNASHTHVNNNHGGKLGLGALTTSGTRNETTYLRGDNTWATVSGGITSLNAQSGSTQTFASGSGITVTSNSNIHTFSLESSVVTTTGAQTLSNKVLTTPTISSFTNATHNHSTTATGGQLGLNALTATGTRNATTFLRGDNTWATVSGGGTPITAGTGLTLASNVMSITAGVQSTITGLGAQSQDLTMGGNDILNLGTISFGDYTITTTSFDLRFNVPSGDFVSFHVGQGNKLTISSTSVTIADDLIMIGHIFAGGSGITFDSTGDTDITGSASVINLNVRGDRGIGLYNDSSVTNPDVAIGDGTILSTTTTTGFLHIPRMNGVPTGTPVLRDNRTPIVCNASNNRLYIYTGSTWTAV